MQHHGTRPRLAMTISVKPPRPLPGRFGHHGSMSTYQCGITVASEETGYIGMRDSKTTVPKRVYAVLRGRIKYANLSSGGRTLIGSMERIVCDTSNLRVNENNGRLQGRVILASDKKKWELLYILGKLVCEADPFERIAAYLLPTNASFAHVGSQTSQHMTSVVACKKEKEPPAFLLSYSVDEMCLDKTRNGLKLQNSSNGATVSIQFRPLELPFNLHQLCSTAVIHNNSIQVLYDPQLACRTVEGEFSEEAIACSWKLQPPELCVCSRETQAIVNALKSASKKAVEKVDARQMLDDVTVMVVRKPLQIVLHGDPGTGKSFIGSMAQQQLSCYPEFEGCEITKAIGDPLKKNMRHVERAIDGKVVYIGYTPRVYFRLYYAGPRSSKRKSPYP